MNHSCSPNACHEYVCVAGVNLQVLYALQNIASGEEITIAYSNWQGIDASAGSYDHIKDDMFKKSPDTHRDILRNKWGIVCEKECACYSSIDDNTVNCKLLDGSIVRLTRSGEMETAMVYVKDLLALHESMNSVAEIMYRIWYDGFQIGVLCDDSTLVEESLLYLKKLY